MILENFPKALCLWRTESKCRRLQKCTGETHFVFIEIVNDFENVIKVNGVMKKFLLRDKNKSKIFNETHSQLLTAIDLC